MSNELVPDKSLLLELLFLFIKRLCDLNDLFGGGRARNEKSL